MAVTATVNVVPADYGAAWSINATSDDFSSCEEAKAAVTAKTHFIQLVIISNGATARTFTIGAGETTNDVTTVLIGPIALAANESHVIPLKYPISAGSAVAVVIDSSGASTGGCVFLQGYTA